ncbi:hypothetical protein [Methanocella arvoryzae]|uniref:Lipoprotein n=1 Tax=Methanocella arvoryzae (strain DSM 22066 / NBRC 105507 / MRE50) TaxID=351160 RepID=Q0W518_METAR|nr:hypothetical protein [Methanocella arvoryzae]CAJ36525.1 hypothetical protein RCIX1221 [Methanocella arvoryzae MRE50]
MKKYVSILLVLLVVAALSVSGCTTPGGDGGKTTPTATPGATDEPGVQPTASATESPGLMDTLSSLYQMSKFTWYEYQYMIDMGEGMTMKMKTKMEFLGQAADPEDGVVGEHIRMTSTTSIPGMGDQTTTNDFYTKPDSDSSDADSDDYWSSTAKIVNVGTETVTVPAGTFVCTKYSVTDSDMEGTSYFWSSPQAPLPVKYSTTVEGQTMDMELVGWG